MLKRDGWLDCLRACLKRQLSGLKSRLTFKVINGRQSKEVEHI
jgi:hypothetical protein